MVQEEKDYRTETVVVCGKCGHKHRIFYAGDAEKFFKLEVTQWAEDEGVSYDLLFKCTECGYERSFSWIGTMFRGR